MGKFIQPSDLAPFATIDPVKAEAMIKTAEARALAAAPCLSAAVLPPAEGATLTAEQVELVLSILRDAILRWDEYGSGVRTAETLQTGPLLQTQTVDTRSLRREFFTSAEMADLKGLCSTDTRSAFTVDMTGGASPHLPWCDVSLGGTVCTCGASLTSYEYPIYELG